jgi:hypothetical protein
MEPGNIAVATVTWCRSEAEERLLIRSLTLLAQSGLPVAVADRGTSRTFSAHLSTFPGFSVTIPSEQGLVAQVVASLERAADFARPFILYVEPDKELFFGTAMADFVRRAPAASDVGVILASRSDESFRTYPAMQRYTEGVINHLCAELIRSPGDYSYGPFVMNAALLPSMASLGPHLGWGWRHFTFLTAARQGFRVLHVTGEYPCPPDQRDEAATDRTHRLRQLSQNILGLLD